MKCPYCGKEVNEGNKFCIGCGAKLENQPAANDNAFNYQPESNNYNYNYNNNKKNTGLIVTIIIVSILLIVGIIVGVILLSGGKKDGNKENNTNNIIEDDDDDDDDGISSSELSKNVKTNGYILEDGSFLVELENKNKVEVSLDVYVDLYDGNNNKVKEDNDSFYVLDPGEKGYLVFYSHKEEFKDYKIKVVAQTNRYYISHKKDIKLASNIEQDDFGYSLDYTNKSDITIDDVEVVLIYYRDGKPVAYDDSFDIDIEPGETRTAGFFYPHDDDYEDIEYDDMKTYVNIAYTYKDLY